MKLVRFLSRGITGTYAVSILAVIIIIHIATMLYYMRDDRTAEQMARRDTVIQKIINAIYLVQATPVQNRAHAVAAIQDPMLHVSFTQQPLHTMQITTISFWQINNILRNHIGNFSLSIKLAENQWLNLRATIYTHLLLTQLLFIAIEIIVFGAILISVWSVNRFTKPLVQFKESAERLGLDLHTQPIDVYGPMVVREATIAMNQMQKRIQDLIRDRTQMLAAISHDLRTPITRMKLRTQILEDNSSMQSFMSDLDEMEAMINETLAFAREDANNEVKVYLDLASLLFSICNDAQDMGHEVTFSSQLHRVPFFGKPIGLKRAFTNLINNGVRYGKQVTVSLEHQYNHFVILIEDEGPGIPEGDLEHVFEPFYRGERSRSRDTGGVGLGLAVTADIIKAHNGHIILKNRNPQGLQAIVQFASEWSLVPNNEEIA